MRSAKQQRRMTAKARRRKYIQLRDRMRADPSDFNRFQYVCRVPAMRQAEMVARWLNAPRPSWEPPR